MEAQLNETVFDEQIDQHVSANSAQYQILALLYKILLERRRVQSVQLVTESNSS